MLHLALFVPNELKEDSQIERFRGIYMPYWIYSFEKDGSYSVSGNKSRRRGDYVYTKHYRLQSHMTAECKGLSYDAASKFADNLSGAIAPFDMNASQAFSPGYLSGFYADRGDVHSRVYYPDASNLAGQYVAKEAGKNRIYSKYGVSRSSMASAFRPKRSEAELGMFPVWFLGCRSHDGQRISYAVVNGQTGKVAADLPIDLGKYLIGSLVLAIPLFFLLNLFLTLTPTKALIAAIVLALVSLFLSNRQLNRIYTRDLRLDDQGLRSVAGSGSTDRNTKRTPRRSSSPGVGSSILRVFGMMAIIWISVPLMGLLFSLGIFRSGFSIVFMMVLWFAFIVMAMIRLAPGSSRSSRTTGSKEVYSAPMKDKWGTLYKPLLAIVIALVILIWDPVSDLYYYIGAAAAMCCVLWSFLDIIKEHNLLTTRKLPQLGKRGGDENA
ncbi:MAG: hypothetical protein J6I64_05755 [Lachnospiraceae bacterium]|nr:hypothetical protein [Lachnospiraceae bacterium]